ncbi:hypothetical protein RI129_006493 [Pyrocoelia pectoralis]|uniref:Reverse transcriptase domain-containing protein n=1 Tax=Pyrocoelia pectoralis TaxID=417401 RepID=A0AAN7VE91_9COLE
MVILNKSDYIAKVEDFINSPGFIKLNSNPTNNFNIKVRHLVFSYRDILSSFNTNYKSILVMNPRPPLLYGLPKIHKPNVPIRPVVSFLNTPASKLTSWLNNLLKTHITLSPNLAIKNSLDLTTKLNSITLPKEFSMVSFDVTNLFPSIPPPTVQKNVSEMF